MAQTKSHSRSSLDMFSPVNLKPVQDDAWSNIFKPPPNESVEERRDRIARQQEAQRVSREIDESILESKKLFDKKKKAIKVLLLGQAESGKSTMLRNFQLAFCPTYFHGEALIWKTIIQLNLIGSVKKLLSIVEDELEMSGPRSRSPTGSTSSSLSDHHRRTRMRLLPLLSMETNLTRQLLPEHYDPSRTPEICVRAGSGWKTVLERVTLERRVPPTGQRRPMTNDGRSKDDPTLVLAASKNDIISLWEDESVREVLKRRGVRLEDSPGFFLTDTARIATVDYEPTEEDIVRARLRTFGVEEHRFLQDNGSEWYIYDVGGSRCMRPQWVPYFDDVQAIIFLAPLSFNQVLEEDRQVNRLEDSIYLWKEVCSNPLLARANIILFLNKMDILQKTLAAGIKVATYVPSYGSTPNDVENVTKYFKEKFRAYHKRLSPRPRTFFCHETSAIDTKATQAVLAGVRDGILRHHLEELNVI
ncbi:G-protein alpha subunit [Suillus plorans]|uniref:G-protein alpha subunit n=2 Tax=Suillus TaxID=5379 RepID=A0A9P7EUK6_9AGAM|nr:G-protein alpha subunit [Suillus plorans]XP_041286098.1 G-protein alpha subunit [Suillus discolor]KAG1792338.1 G-protein alpha subunit [Suillus plorans]KAG2090100.1 G-protein alpha subunit [Suillus discolor]